jgi:CheY-like chemotaxis protein
MANSRRILVVEDEDDWRTALVDMYGRIFPSSKVCSARDGDEALRELRKRPVDLLSQDINLAAEVGPGEPKARVDGREVLRRAHDEQLARVVICITALPYDQKLRWAVPDPMERKGLWMTLEEYLRKVFPGRYRLWPKREYVEARVFVKEIEAQQKAQIQKLVTDARRSAALEPPYLLSGKRSDPHALFVSSKSNPAAEVRISRPADVEFLDLLVRCRTEKVALGKESAVATLSGRHPASEAELDRRATSDIEAFRTRLKRAGVTEPTKLVDVVRGQGWVLHNTVRVRMPGAQFKTYDDGVRYE